jgi:NAD dependent epimerase/dehydratase family enzyme
VRKRRLPIIGGGTGYFSWVHLDDAASATVLAVEQRANGVFNIVDDEPARVSEWLPYLAACVGAKRPLRIPKWLVRPLAGEMGVAIMTGGAPLLQRQGQAGARLEAALPHMARGLQGRELT